MEMFFLGFILGAIACWLWFHRFHSAARFQHLLQRELTAQHPTVNEIALEKKIAELDQRLQILQQQTSVSMGASGTALPDSLTYSAGEAPPDQPSIPNRAAQKDIVLTRWKEGADIDEIASRSGIGKGEIELIIKLQGKTATRSLEA